MVRRHAALFLVLPWAFVLPAAPARGQPAKADDLPGRVQQLEKRVAELEGLVKQLQARPKDPARTGLAAQVVGTWVSRSYSCGLAGLGEPIVRSRWPTSTRSGWTMSYRSPSLTISRSGRNGRSRRRAWMSSGRNMTHSPHWISVIYRRGAGRPRT